ncbi:Uncharacterised protein [Bordetella ansorpii]|uniref:Uncharacterized protein n=1 Tax=Bordetella ansorpii TaxID=288768 RepID=A0A157SJN4_9BORD|nr:hypothetical protein [Bordetella ansorpii]SAI70471.1 Uncharacterised protein [Bordetella ansorpii]
MTKQVINTGTSPNDGTGDPARTAFAKANSNFDELYTAIGNGVVPLTQKGAANGVAALSGRSELSNRLLAAGLASGPAVMSTDGSSGSQFRVTYSHAAVVRANDGSANPAFLTYYPTAVANANGMYALEFIGYAHSGVASLIRFGLSFFYQSSSSTFSNVNLTHFGVRRPTVRLGVNADGRPVVIVATDSVGWTHAVLDSALMSHSNATDDYIRSWTGGSATDLTAFTNVVVAPDLGPLSRSGDTMTGPLQVPIGSASAASVAIGASNTGLYSGGASTDLTVAVNGSSRVRFMQAEMRTVGPVAFASSIAATSDVLLTRSGTGVFAVTALNGTTFSGPVTVGQGTGSVLTFRPGSIFQIQSSRTATAGRIDIDDIPVDATDSSTINFNRSVTTSGSVTINFCNGDGSLNATHAFRSGGTNGPASSWADLARGGGRVGIGGVNTAGRTLRVYGDTQIDGRTFLGSYTQATLPTASSSTGCIAWCSNAAGGAAEVQCDGTEWISLKTGLPVGLQAYVSGAIGDGTYGTWTARRYADGSMECTMRFIIVSGGFAAGAQVSLAATPTNWPVTFTSVDRLHTNYVGDWSPYMYSSCSAIGATLTTSTGGVYIKNLGNGNTGSFEGAVYLTAKGRWKA